MPKESKKVASPADLQQLFNWGCFDLVKRNARSLLKQRPADGSLWLLLGASQMRLGQDEDAAQTLRRAVQLLPADAAAAALLAAVSQRLGVALFTQLNEAVLAGRLVQALVPARRLVELNEADATAHSNLAVILGGLGQWSGALEHGQRAIALAPESFDFLIKQAALLGACGRAEESLLLRRQAFGLCPDNVDNNLVLAQASSVLGQAAEAAFYCRGGRDEPPQDLRALSSLLFYLSLDEGCSPEQVYAAHLDYGRRVAATVPQDRLAHGNVRDPQRRLRVGFVSADLRQHPVAGFIAPVWAALDPQQVEVCVYAVHAENLADATTEQLRPLAAHWVDAGALSDSELAERIHADGIDILFDLAGHTRWHRLQCFAERPAPLQVTWIGYPNTTGLQAMDYALCDPFNAPHGGYERFYVEKFARIPCSGTFEPQGSLPSVNELPALDVGRVTFGSFNRVEKLGPQVLAAWARVLTAVPEARLMLGNVSDAATAARLREDFARQGIAPERLVFRPRQALPDYLALHHEIDLMLDTWPYSGGTTTNYALAMGVPVVTLRGPSRAHCQSAGVLGRIGLHEWIADDVDGWVEIAVRGARDLTALAALRASLRERWAATPRRRPEAVARGLELALRRMWGRWCEGLPAEHLEVSWDEVQPLLQGGAA